MSKHLFGLVVTPYGTAGNNRGESEGNITTLQKILWNGEIHTTVSAEAIRFAIRRYWESSKGEDQLNRRWRDVGKPHHEWKDHEFKDWQRFIDDDVLGFMSAEAGKEETNDAEDEQSTGKRKKKNRGTATIRRGRLEITRAISLIPFAGDITFNAAGIGATPSASSTGEHPVPYGAEIHATRYQYGFALTPESLSDSSRSIDVVNAITSLSKVAGNHSRFLYDFSPDAVIYRWTDDFAPRMLYGFSSADNQPLSIPEILGRIKQGDIDASEVIVGASTPNTFDSEVAGQLENLKVKVLGVKAAAEEVKRRIRADLKLAAS